MATNPYFNKFRAPNEQKLLDKLVQESINIKGEDVLYLPRTLIKSDQLLGEDVLSEFQSNYPIAVYIATQMGFEGDGEFMSKFGIEIADQLELVVSRSEFSESLSGIDMQRPRLGDLIYFPLTDSLFVIQFVEDDKPFLQLGSQYTYSIRVELFEYSHETFTTGIPEIDNIYRSSAYTIELVLGAGSGNYTVDEEVYQGSSLANATAKALITSWDSDNSKLRIRKIIGEFATGTNVIGDSSSASYSLTSFSGKSVSDNQDDTDVFDDEDGHIVDDGNPFGDV